jgi:hypothetical protein
MDPKEKDYELNQPTRDELELEVALDFAEGRRGPNGEDDMTNYYEILARGIRALRSEVGKLRAHLFTRPGNPCTCGLNDEIIHSCDICDWYRPDGACDCPYDIPDWYGPYDCPEWTLNKRIKTPDDSNAAIDFDIDAAPVKIGVSPVIIDDS